MFSRTAFRNLKHRTKKGMHKTKKGMMLRIRKTESRPEDPAFKHFLATLYEIKVEIRDIYDKSRKVAAAGKKHHENLEKLGGLGLSSEDVFRKETEFLNKLEDLVCAALGRIVKDINKLNDLILRYKVSKFKFEAVRFKIVKQMRKKGINVSVWNSDKVMNTSSDLQTLHKAYIASKWKLRWWRDVILSKLKCTIGPRITELKEVSAAEHHVLYCYYFKKRLVKTLEFCSDEIVSPDACKYVRSATFSHRSKERNIAGNLVRSFTAGIGLGLEDEKDTELETNDNCPIEPRSSWEDGDDESVVSVSEDILPPSCRSKNRTYSSGEEYFGEPRSPQVDEQHDNSKVLSKMLSIMSLRGQDYDCGGDKQSPDG